MPVVNLNADFIAHHLQCPDDKKQIEYVDNARSGLYVLVSRTSPNRGTYYLRYKDAAGKTCHRKLAGTGDLSIQLIKSKIKTLRAEIALGADPQAEIKEKRNEMLFSTMMDDHVLPYYDIRRKTAPWYRRLYEIQLKPVFGNIQVSSIKKSAVGVFHDRLLSLGYSKAYSNRFIQLMKSSFNIANHTLEIIDLPRNPIVGIPLFEESPRERYLSNDELSRLLPVLDNAEGRLAQPARIIKYLILTGLRISECCHCRWDEIDFSTSLMHIPGSRSKNHVSASVPLSTSAIKILNECDRSVPYPFANPQTGLPYVSIRKAFNTLMDRAKIIDVSPHDMRRTAGSLILSSGGSLTQVQHLLRHKSYTTTDRHYGRLAPHALAAASDSICEQLSKMATGES
jgi:integrase